MSEKNRFRGASRPPRNRRDQLGERIGRCGFRKPPRRRSGFRRERKNGRAGAVLPAVALLFEKQREERSARIRPPRKRIAGLSHSGRSRAGIVSQPQQRHCAFMFDWIGHRSRSQVRKVADSGIEAGFHPRSARRCAGNASCLATTVPRARNGATPAGRRGRERGRKDGGSAARDSSRRTLRPSRGVFQGRSGTGRA